MGYMQLMQDTSGVVKGGKVGHWALHTRCWILFQWYVYITEIVLLSSMIQYIKFQEWIIEHIKFQVNTRNPLYWYASLKNEVLKLFTAKFGWHHWCIVRSREFSVDRTSNSRFIAGNTCYVSSKQLSKWNFLENMIKFVDIELM